MKHRFALLVCIVLALVTLLWSPARAQNELFLIASNEPGAPYGNKAVNRYNTATGQSLGYFVSRTDSGMSDFHWGGTFGPDGNLYVADYFGGSISKFDGSTGAFLGYMVPPGGVGNPVHIRFGPDGYLYAAANGGPAVVRFNGATGDFVDVPVPGNTPNLGYPQDLVFGPDGKLYISTYGSSAVLRYDPQTGITTTFVTPGSGGLSSARQMAFGPDGNLYVTSQDSGTVKKYSSANGAFLGDFLEPGHIGGNLAVAFSPDGNYLYTDGGIPVAPGYGIARYNGHTGAFIDYLVVGDTAANFLFNAQGVLFCIGGNEPPPPPGTHAVSHYNASTGQSLGFFVSRADAGMTDFHWGGTFGPDGNLYVADYFGGSISKFDGSTGAFLGYFVPPGGVGAPVYIKFGADGYLYVSSNGSPSVVRFNGATGDFVDVAVPEWTENIGYPQDLIFGADGKLYISTFGTNAVLRYDPQNGTTETFVEPGSGGLSSARQMAFGPDGNLYVTSQDDSTIKRYSGATGEYLGDFIEPGHVGNNLALAFSPDGNYLYVSGLIPVSPGYGVVRYNGHTGAFIDNFIVGDSTANLIFNTGRTNSGSNVAVAPTPTTTLTFTNITSGGQTVITPLNDGDTPLPENFAIPEATGGLPTYFDISTTASFTGQVTLGIGYDATVFRSDINPTGPNPRLLHYANGQWVDITTTFDTVAHKVYGVTSSFSPFAIASHAAYSWSGVLQPINTDGSSIFKKGSTVPVKFKLTGADAGIKDLQAKLYISQVSSVDPSEANEADSTSAADSGNTFRYDSTTGQYIFNLSTKNLTQGTWYLRIDLGDGVDHIVQIKLKK